MSEQQPKWTPGPWTADQGNLNGIQIGPGDEYVIELINEDGDPHLTDEDWANARLIAAAPELYDALNWCVSLLADCKTEGVFTTAVEQGIRALAKARGDA